MSGGELDPAVAAAEAYEGLHVPALFRQWAPRLLDSVGIREGDRVLDVACGTGVVAREAARRLKGSGRVVGVDVAAGMLQVAERILPTAEWTQASAESLPFASGSFDVVACQFGLMFFEDRAEALSEFARVLTPAGTLVAAVWDRLENSGAYALEVALLERLAGANAANALRAPFVLGDPMGLEELFRIRGVSEARITTLDGKARFPSVREMVEADLRGWLPIMGVHLGEGLIQEILQTAEHDLAHFVDESGALEFDSPAHIVRVSKEG